MSDARRRNIMISTLETIILQSRSDDSSVVVPILAAISQPAGPYRDPSALSPESGPEQPLRPATRQAGRRRLARPGGPGPAPAGCCPGAAPALLTVTVINTFYSPGFSTKIVPLFFCGAVVPLFLKPVTRFYSSGTTSGGSESIFSQSGTVTQL